MNNKNVNIENEQPACDLNCEENNVSSSLDEEVSSPEDQTPLPEDTKPQKEPYVYPPIAPKQPVRRVGTLTMGLSLIAVGIVALICMIDPNFDLTLVVKFAPLIFVFLGIEILVGYFFARKGEKLKYDFLSGFVCFLLICGAAGVSTLPYLWDYWGPQVYQQQEQLSEQIEETMYSRLSSNKGIRSLDVYLNLNDRYSKDTTYDTLPATANIHMNIALFGPFEDEKAFARACKNILTKIADYPVNFTSINFSSDWENDGYANLDISDRFQRDMDADTLSQLVNFHPPFTENGDGELFFDGKDNIMDSNGNLVYGNIVIGEDGNIYDDEGNIVGSILLPWSDYEESGQSPATYEISISTEE